MPVVLHPLLHIPQLVLLYFRVATPIDDTRRILPATQHPAQLRGEVTDGEIVGDGDESAVPQLIAIVQSDASAGEVHCTLDAVRIG
jgi:hypothetical protein